MVTKELNKTESKKSLKRKKIIEAASLLFAQKNYHEVMMDDVAKLASIAKGTVYNYYESKEELYFSIMQLRMEKLISSLREKISTEMSSFDSLKSFIIHLYMFMMKYKHFFLMYRKESLNAENELCAELNNLETELKKIFYRILNKGKTERFFRNVDEQFAVELVLGSLYGAVYRGIEKNYDEIQMVSERENVYEFILHGLIGSRDDNKTLPLKNKTIVITRSIEQSKESSEAFRQLGADVIIFPTLDIVPPADWEEFDSIITSPEGIDFIIFTSAHAVKMFSKRCNELSFKPDYEKSKVVAIGNKTAAVCERMGIPVHIIPAKFSSKGVVEELIKYNLNEKIIFVPRSAIGREELPIGLKELGAVIKTAVVYNVALPSSEIINDNIELLKLKKPDLFVFTSPSTFDNFLEILKIQNPGEYFTKFDVAAIGPTTKAAIESKNVKVTIMPDEFTIDGLIKASIDFYKNK
jgi:uroporphyrinogen III methyltransferase/synthase